MHLVCCFKERGFLGKVPFGAQQMTHMVSQPLAPGLFCRRLPTQSLWISTRDRKTVTSATGTVSLGR